MNFHSSPPTISVDDEGASVLFDGHIQWHIEWNQVVEVAIVVSEGVLTADEAFWELKGGPTVLGAPIDLVVGASAFSTRLMSFHGFDHDAYHRACEAERRGVAWRGVDYRVICWRRNV